MRIGRLITAFLAVTVFAGATSVKMSYDDFLKKKEAEKEERISYYREISDRETEWILSLQQEDGSLFLYKPGEGDSGHINPYFACEAMLGVISDGNPEHVEAVGRYLHWHTAALIEEEGIISDYKMEDGIPIPKGDSDSFDSYAAEYLLLFSEYVERGGDPETVGDYRSAIYTLARRFEEVLLYDVTFVRKDHNIAYLMDNAEVYEGMIRTGKLLTTDKRFTSDRELYEIGQEYLDIAKGIKAAIEDVYWLDDAGAYTIGIEKNGESFGTPDFAEFYPDAVAQLYPGLMGVNTIGEREQSLYSKVCASHDWEHGKIEGTTFHWTVMAYVAVVYGDTGRLNTYLEEYKDIVNESRSYPLHTASAGWIVRACNSMIDNINNEKDTGFLKYIEWLIGEIA